MAGSVTRSWSGYGVRRTFPASLGTKHDTVWPSSSSLVPYSGSGATPSHVIQTSTSFKCIFVETALLGCTVFDEKTRPQVRWNGFLAWGRG